MPSKNESINAAISPRLPDPPFVAPSRPRAATRDQRREQRHFPLARQLGVINEMIESIDTLTVPGKRQTMGKVVGFIQHQASRACLAMSPRNQNVLVESVRRLTHESSRLSPDLRVFIRRAKSLVALLNALA